MCSSLITIELLLAMLSCSARTKLFSHVQENTGMVDYKAPHKAVYQGCDENHRNEGVSMTKECSPGRYKANSEFASQDKIAHPNSKYVRQKRCCIIFHHTAKLPITYSRVGKRLEIKENVRKSKVCSLVC